MVGLGAAESGLREDSSGDRNPGPWIVEEVSKGPCLPALVTTLQGACAFAQAGLFQASKRSFQHRVYKWSNSKILVTVETGRTVSHSKEEFVWCSCISQGYREYQEDRKLTAKPIVFKSDDSQEEFLLFAVFDGHGQPLHGHKIAEYCEMNFVEFLQKELDSLSVDRNEKNKANGLQKKFKLSSRVYTDNETNASEIKDIQATIFTSVFERVCKNMDEAIRRKFPTISIENGTTLSCFLLGDTRVVFANLGDSRAAQYAGDSSNGNVIFATYDHKPTRFDEADRIRRAGGWIEAGRVNGDLAVSRTIGDLEYKPKGCPARLCPISSKPSVTSIKRVNDNSWEEMYLVATDGLWDAISTKDAFDFIRKYAQKRRKELDDSKFQLEEVLSDALERLLRFVFRSRLASDNVTAIVVVRIGLKQTQENDKTDPTQMTSS